MTAKHNSGEQGSLGMAVEWSRNSRNCWCKSTSCFKFWVTFFVFVESLETWSLDWISTPDPAETLDLGPDLTTTFSGLPNLVLDLTIHLFGLLDFELNLVTPPSGFPDCGLNPRCAIWLLCLYWLASLPVRPRPQYTGNTTSPGPGQRLRTA